MSALSAAKAILEADATLLATATGGVWSFDETGRLGLSRTLTPAAFDSTGRIKPCVLLKVRSRGPFGGIADGGSQFVATREVLEVWLYEDTGYANIDIMRDRVFTLLHNVQLSGSFACLWEWDVRGARDTDLDASVERSDYAVIGKRS